MAGSFCAAMLGAREEVILMMTHGPRVYVRRQHSNPWLLVLSALVAAFAAVLFVAGARSASEPSGLIAFTRDDGVYVMGRDGTGLRPLWQGRRPTEVTWSPDGRKLAFGIGALWGTRGGGIWIMNAWSNPVRVASVPATSLTWSPDGRRIAFTDKGDIWLMNADGSNIRLLKRTPRLSESNVDWKPTGGWLAFDRGGFVSQLYVIRTNGRNLQAIGSTRFDAREPDWSPDGRRLAFREDWEREIWVMNANGTSPVRVTRNDFWERSPAWSPDGRKIAFVRGNPFSGRIYVMNADGTGVRKLTKGESPAWLPVAAP
jgi:Tol biopolymer transport system component